LSESVRNLQQNYSNISHQSPQLKHVFHYLVKFKMFNCLYILILDYSGYKHLPLKSDFFSLKLISIQWAAMATFFVSFTVTNNGFN